MEALVRLSFYCFAAASIAFGGRGPLLPRLRRRRSSCASDAADERRTTVVASSAALEAGSPGVAAGHDASWFGVAFAALAVGLGRRRPATCRSRTCTSSRSPSSMLIGIVYLLFERAYGVRQLGRRRPPDRGRMCLYIWSLPAGLREVEP
jgi:hypothetical protein